jgi:DNA-binding SARP family transcriptional activator/predicted ATPase
MAHNQLALRLLGASEAMVAGAPLAVNHQKARALLFYLAVTSRHYTRDHLATLFWGDSDATGARHSLRSTLYLLRRALRDVGAETVLQAQGDLVSLQLPESSCDVLTFRRLVAESAEPALSAAVSLYRGPFLQGFSLTDAPAFDDWVFATGDDLSQAYRVALDCLAGLAEAREDWPAAASYAQRIVQLDPLNEVAQRRLIALHLREGALGKALRQYDALEVELRQELGITPEPATQALVADALRQRQPGAPSPTRAQPLPVPSAPFPFVGRHALLDQLTALNRDIISGHGMTVLIEGEDGSGKTRLVTELATRLSAAERRWVILRGACSPFTEILPYGPFHEAFQHAALGDLSGLLSEPGDLDAPEARGSFLFRVLQGIRVLTRSAPLLLAIDDIDSANSATLQLFGFLASRVRDLPVLLAGTIQRADLVPDLQRLIALGRRHGEVQLHRLEPLSRTEVADLLQAMPMSSPSLESLADWLEERSEGNPFIVGELLAQLRTEGMLTLADETWHLETQRWLKWRMSAALPETTHDLVNWRLASLTGQARQLLDVLAVAYEPLPFDLLRALSHGPGDTTLAIFDDLLARRLVVESPADRVKLAHHLLREALQRQLSGVRLKAIHRQLAGMLEDCPALAQHVPTRLVAHHAVAGEDVERARRCGLSILDELAREEASQAQIAFLRDLRDLLSATATPQEHLRLARALGHAYRSAGQLDDARAALQQALTYASQVADPCAEADVCFEQAELALVASDDHAALASATAGLVLLGEPTDASHSAAQMGRGHRLIGAALAMNGRDLAAAEYHLREAIAAYERDADPGEQARTFFELGNVFAQRGEIEHALESYRAAARQAETAGERYYLALAHNNLAYHALLLGRLTEARRDVATGRRIAERASLPAALLYLASTEGEIHLYQGDWAAARESFERGLALAEDLGSIERQAGYRGGLAQLARAEGDPERAIALLEEALALIEGSGFWHLRTRLRIWLAETLLHQGTLARAEALLDDALDSARSHDRALLLVQALRLHAALLAASGQWEAAEESFARLARRTDGTLESARTLAAWGAAALRHGPATHRDAARARLSEARAQFAPYEASAEIAVIEALLRA